MCPIRKGNALEALDVILRLLATLAIGAACGLLLKKTKFPAAYMVGAFAGVAVFNCATGGMSFLPDGTRMGIQIVAGAFVGCSMERGDVKRLPRIGLPALLMLCMCLLLMIIVGVAITLVSPIDLRTGLMCAVPGGINDTPIVAADMGADPVAVTVCQLIRQVLGIAVFPAMIAAFGNLRSSRGLSDERTKADVASDEKREKSSRKGLATVVVALCGATVGGFLGKATGIPGMTFAGSIVVVLVLKLAFDFASVPKWLKKVCQLVAGCYLGTLFTFDELLSMGYLILPVLVIIAGYTLNCFICGWLESRLFGYGRREGMLIASPAGASDMVLIIDDMGIKNTDIAVLQVIRATVVMTTFPQVVNLICFLIGG